MPRFLRAARIGSAILGAVLVAAGIVHVAPLPVPGERATAPLIVWAAVGIGAFLLVPHRRVMKPRLAPFWIALSFLLPAGTAIGLAMAWLNTFKWGADPIVAGGATVYCWAFARTPNMPGEALDPPHRRDTVERHGWRPPMESAHRGM